MDKILIRKINLLLHLAKVDGQFDNSEVNLLKSILKEKGLQESYLNEHKQEMVNLDQIKEMPDKGELLYWILKLIHADHHLHPAEIAYSKIIARQLNFSEDLITYFEKNPIPERIEFERVIDKFNLSPVK